MKFYLDHDLKQYFSDSGSLFDQLMKMEGEVYRNQDGRKTQRVVIGGNPYFIKQYSGVGWGEIFKNLIQFRQPVLGAKNEWQAIQALERIGIHVPKLAGYGERGWNPASKESFVLMEAVTDSPSLEEITQQWRQSPPSFEFKMQLIKEVAVISRKMHQHNINHRDFYICHFLYNPQIARLYVIDLHRAQIRRWMPERWLIKDLAGLYFSSKDIGLTSHDLLRFVKYYRDKPLCDVMEKEEIFWAKVKARGEKLYREHQHGN